MIRYGFLLLSFIISGMFTLDIYSQQFREDYSKPYDESIYIISNYSGISATAREELKLEELISSVDGFIFNVVYNSGNNALMLKNADGSFMPFAEALKILGPALSADTGRVITLFLEYRSDVAKLEHAFRDAGILSRLYSHGENTRWPSLQEMVTSESNLVVFSMQPVTNSPSWMHYIWTYALEPSYLSTGEIVYTNESFEYDPLKTLQIFNGFNSAEMSEIQHDLTYYVTQKPYFIELFNNTWNSTGKIPNFVFLDRYEWSIAYTVNTLRGFPVVKGSAVHENDTLNYIAWEGINSLTSGKFSFIIIPGEKLMLTPKSPGYKFTPESIVIDESFSEKNVVFRATPLDIYESLEAYFKFENNVKDLSYNRFDGSERNIEYMNDPVRGQVVKFNEQSLISLAGAEELSIRDHDFTVSVWIRIPEYLPEKTDYCVLSSKIASYQSGLHLVIRNKQPYMGFFNDDLAGRAVIEEGRWYHIVWRYNKLSREQAIFINGRLDASSLRRPSYKGSDTIYIGANYYAGANMIGDIDDLSIWSRALGEEEIMSLYNQTITLNPPGKLTQLSPLFKIITGSLIALILISFWLLYKRKNKSGSESSGEDSTSQHYTYQPNVRNMVRLFGDFTVIDAAGNNITGQFTPKLKQLFLILLINSGKDKNGIPSRELSEVLWKGQTAKNAKNLRGVTIRNLRLLLGSMDKIDIIYQSDTWSLKFSGSVYCDYVDCIRMLEENNNNSKDFFNRFYNIIKEGEVFRGESFHWLDDNKGFIGNHIVDILINFLESHSDAASPDKIIKISELILVYDPANEIALSFKVKMLVRQNNLHLARFTYERFCTLYEEMYGERFGKTFSQVAS